MKYFFIIYDVMADDVMPLDITNCQGRVGVVHISKKFGIHAIPIVENAKNQSFTFGESPSSMHLPQISGRCASGKFGRILKKFLFLCHFLGQMNGLSCNQIKISEVGLF